VPSTSDEVVRGKRQRRSMSDKEALAAIREKRKARNVTYQELSKAVGKNPTYLAAALRGQQRLSREDAVKLAAALGLEPDDVGVVSDFPVRTEFPITTDPFKYRLLEIVGVYGDALRDQANDMFGDGIMSAIDFSIDMEKVTGSQGETRVKITMNGKWLPYREF
jgi:cyanate lyase